MSSVDPHRPAYHFVPPSGWLNDPNGLCEWDGRFHLFYQHNPHEPRHGDIHWGHASGTDLVHWTDEPVALAPGDEADADADGCFSGVLVDDGGTPTIVYSGHRDGVGQRTCVAVGSADLRTWTKDPGNPVLGAPPGLDLVAHRDHCVWREADEWRQLVGSGLPGRGGTALLYRSPDLRSWEYVGPLVVGDAAVHDPVWTGTMWECVDLFRLGPEDGAAPDVMAFSVWDDERTLHPALMTGRYDGRRFRPARTQALDHGRRYCYAPQTFRAADGRRILFGWMQEGRPDRALRAAGWAGAMTLPRVLRMDEEGMVVMEPDAAVARLRRAHEPFGTVHLRPGDHARVDPGAGDQLDVEAVVEVPVGAGFELVVRATPDGGEATVVSIDGSRDAPEVRVALDRTRSSRDPEVDREPLSGPVPVAPDRVVRLRVLVDHSVLEVFANGRPLSARIYPTRDDAAGLAVAARGRTVVVERLDVWRMASTWQDADGPARRPAR